jgi:tRNA-dihydrouridine synthase B
MRIGRLDLGDKPLFLAPMEDVTDISFRHICKSYGVDFMTTEFIPSEALIRNIERCYRKMSIVEDERPVAIQIYGHVLESMIEAAKIVEQMNPDVIDINFGCPVKKIAARGAGAGMLRNIPLMVKMTEEICKAVNLPVTVKTRLGWDESDKPIIEVAERLQDAGAQALTIHGRTKSQLYKGTADWSLIGEVKNNARMCIPIIGNGDIQSPEDAKRAFDLYGVDGIMIGRASIGRPWIFRDVKHYLNTGELLPEMRVNEKAALAKRQFYKSVEYKQGKRGIYEMRRHFCNYFKGLPNFKELRLQLVTSEDPDEIIYLLDEVNRIYGNDY